MRRWAGLERPGSGTRETGAAGGRFGVRRHYRLAPWSDRVEVHWADGAEAYVTPVGPRPGRRGDALERRTAAGFDDLLGRFPALAARLAGAPDRLPRPGLRPARQRARGVVRRRGSPWSATPPATSTPITGEGLSLAFHHAFALVHAVADVLAGAPATSGPTRAPTAACAACPRP